MHKVLCPEPVKMENWSIKGDLKQFRIGKETIETLKKNKISYLFPIQFETYDYIYDGRDVIGRDRTGNGKTLAFSLPILERFRKEKIFNGKSPIFFIVLPTRELVLQTVSLMDELKNSDNEFRVLGIYGGKNYEYQLSRLEKGVDVIVGTPGRLIDLMKNKKAINLSKLETIVLDETDVMLDFGFEKDIKEIIQLIEKQLTKPENLQKLFFSATIPEKFYQMAKKYINSEAIHIDLVQKNENQTSITVKHYAVTLNNEYDKKDSIKKIFNQYLKDDGQAIIFTNTKIQASELEREDLGCTSKSIHGDVKQFLRERIYHDFKSKKIRVLIATNVAARGLDISNVDVIIQIEPPQDVDSYIHRSGRTGRAGKKGLCFTLFNKRNQFKIGQIEDVIKTKMEKIKISDQSSSRKDISLQKKNLDDYQSDSSRFQNNGRYCERKWDKREEKRDSFSSFRGNERENGQKNRNRQNGNSNSQNRDQFKLFFGNLDRIIDKESLEKFLNQHEFFPENVYIPQQDGESRGFGFVTFSSQEDVDRAKELDNYSFHGKNLRIKAAKPKSDK